MRPALRPSPNVLVLAHDLDVRIVDAFTGELLRELRIDPDRDYQPRNPARHRHQK